ncbi:MAG: T9SS type A sorting domain-containing protein [Flavobacteriales bacterium]|nr:T9SS type A sorting domain-containing protein [Flavobacteriales bacterium]
MPRTLPLITIALLCTGSTSAQFGPRIDLHTGITYMDPLVADLDNDGDQDIVLKDSDTGIQMLENVDGLGSFGPLQTVVALDQIGHVEVCDLDGDQDVDLLAHRSYADELLWFENDGTGSFTPGTLLTTVPGQMIICADIVGSPLPEVVFRKDSSVYWLENSGGTFLDMDSLWFGAPVSLFDAGDVDMDGDVDLVGVHQEQIMFGLNPGNGSSWSTAVMPGYSSTWYTRSKRLIDCDGDGDLDLVDAGFNVRWVENLVADSGVWGGNIVHVVDPNAPNEGAGWAAPMGCGPGAGFLWCHWVYAGPVYWSHYDHALGGFSAPAVSGLRGAGDGRLVIGDLNGDARQDVIITHNDTVSWYANDLPGAGGSVATVPPLDTLCAWGLNAYHLPEGLPADGRWTGTCVDWGHLFHPTGCGLGAGTYPMAYGAIDAQGCIASAFATVEVINEPTVEVTASDPQCPDAVLQLIGAPTGGLWSAPADAQGRVYTDCASRPINTDVVYTFTDVTGHPCPSDATTAVNVLPCTPVFFGEVDPLCEDTAPLSVPLAVPAGGVSYFLEGVDSSTYDGGIFVTGWFSPDQGPGLWPVVAAAVAPGECPFPDTLLVEVLSAPLVSFALGLDTLTDCTAVLPLTEGLPSGGQYTIDGSATSYTAFEAAVWGIGTHTVTYMVVDPNGCPGAVTDTLVVDCSTWVGGLMDPASRLWPNPADDRLFIAYTGTPASLELFDMMGRSVARWSATSSPMTVDVSHLPSGSYTLRMGSAAIHPVMIR